MNARNIVVTFDFTKICSQFEKDKFSKNWDCVIMINL